LVYARRGDSRYFFPVLRMPKLYKPVNEYPLQAFVQRDIRGAGSAES
jgi:hypothetical protein